MAMLSRFLDSFYKGNVPNKFTVGMGELIRKARLEAKMSQAELAQKAHFRQAAISQIEAGKREVTATDLLYLSYSLNKPIIYFFPQWLKLEKSEEGDLTPLEKELLLVSRKLDSDDDLRRLIAIARGLVNYGENQPFEDLEE
jgi:transcriptional regulator with XRE-family HTH domain